MRGATAARYEPACLRRTFAETSLGASEGFQGRSSGGCPACR